MSSEKSQKVSLYSVNDLKNATDDALAPYLTTLPKPYTFVQQHGHTNTRLVVGYSAVIIAAATFVADWKLGWDETKSYTAVACVLYFILNSFLTYHIWLVEAGRVFVGVRAGGQKLTLQSSTQKYKPAYKLKVCYEAPSGQKWENKEIEGKFMEWFSEDGYLQQPMLKRWLAKNIEVVGLADSQTNKVGGLIEVQDESFASGALSVEDRPIVDGTGSARAKKPRKKV